MLDVLEGKTLLVTGATGFIGSHLVARLRQVHRAKLLLLSRAPGPVEPGSVTWIHADCENLTRNHWRSAGVSRIDYVFHLAAATPKINTVARVDDAYAGNLTGTRALLNSLPAAPERFIFASTLDVYAPHCGEVISEATSVAPTGPYGLSKVACENAVVDYGRSHGCHCQVLRYGHIFGPGEEAYQKLIPQAIRQLLSGQAPVVYGDGSAERDYLYVADVVEASIRAAVGRPSAGPINIVRGSSVPIRHVVSTLASLTRFPGTIRYLADKSSGNSLRFDNRKMQCELGQWTLVPLESGLEREVNYFRTASSTVQSSS